MDRRTFFRFAAVSPMIIATAANASGAAPVGYERVSIEKGDPGERAYAMACGDDKRIEVYRDGVKEDHAIMADAKLGVVKRTVITPDGNVAINEARGEVLTEEVYGRVEIRLIDKPRSVYRQFARGDAGKEVEIPAVHG